MELNSIFGGQPPFGLNARKYYVQGTEDVELVQEIKQFLKDEVGLKPETVDNETFDDIEMLYYVPSLGINNYIHKLKKNNLLSLIIQKQYKCVNEIIANKKSETQEKLEGEQN